MPYHYALTQHGSTLATRPFGKRLRIKITEEATGCDCLELDFSGILSVSHSFADELVAQLAEEAEAEIVGFNVTISRTAPEVEDVVHRALDRRGVKLAQLA
jgi:STAS-like domain of unknown function (DUF4325)